jgi:hypothetical protein
MNENQTPVSSLRDDMRPLNNAVKKLSEAAVRVEADVQKPRPPTLSFTKLIPFLPKVQLPVVDLFFFFLMRLIIFFI